MVDWVLSPLWAQSSIPDWWAKILQATQHGPKPKQNNNNKKMKRPILQQLGCSDGLSQFPAFMSLCSFSSRGEASRSSFTSLPGSLSPPWPQVWTWSWRMRYQSYIRSCGHSRPGPHWPIIRWQRPEWAQLDSLILVQVKRITQVALEAWKTTIFSWEAVTVILSHHFGAGLLCSTKCHYSWWGFPGGKEPTCQCRRHETQVWSLGRSPGGGHGNPLRYPCLENPVDRGTWATDHMVAKSWTRLKWQHIWWGPAAGLVDGRPLAWARVALFLCVSRCRGCSRLFL